MAEGHCVIKNQKQITRLQTDNNKNQKNLLMFFFKDSFYLRITWFSLDWNIGIDIKANYVRPVHPHLASVIKCWSRQSLAVQRWGTPTAYHVVCSVVTLFDHVQVCVSREMSARRLSETEGKCTVSGYGAAVGRSSLQVTVHSIFIIIETATSDPAVH